MYIVPVWFVTLFSVTQLCARRAQPFPFCLAPQSTSCPRCTGCSLSCGKQKIVIVPPKQKGEWCGNAVCTRKLDAKLLLDKEETACEVHKRPAKQLDWCGPRATTFMATVGILRLRSPSQRCWLHNVWFFHVPIIRGSPTLLTPGTKGGNTVSAAKAGQPASFLNTFCFLLQPFSLEEPNLLLPPPPFKGLWEM